MAFFLNLHRFIIYTLSFLLYPSACLAALYPNESNNQKASSYSCTLGSPISTQQQSVGELILRILEEGAQMMRCLRIFLCETLQGISDDMCLSPERKLKLAKELFSTSAQKDTSLAAVIEAASKF